MNVPLTQVCVMISRIEKKSGIPLKDWKKGRTQMDLTKIGEGAAMSGLCVFTCV